MRNSSLLPIYQGKARMELWKIMASRTPTQSPSLILAINNLTPAAVVRSWDATGIPRALWGDVPSADPMVEVLQATLVAEHIASCECGILTPRKCPTCSEHVCDGCFPDHVACVCP